MAASRCHIHTKPAPPAFPYPAKFRLGEENDYVRYGYAPFDQGRRGGDSNWTPEVITQTWYEAETGRIIGTADLIPLGCVRGHPEQISEPQYLPWAGVVT